MVQDHLLLVVRRYGGQPMRIFFGLLIVFALSAGLWSRTQLRTETLFRSSQKPHEVANDPKTQLYDFLLDSNSSSQTTYSTIGKVTTITNYEETGYELGLKTHKRHADIHGYPLYILRDPLLGGVWDKIGFLQSIILDELYKPPGQRLEWLMWCDADTVVLNSQIPLEIFLPPRDFQHVNLLIAKDWNGINAGTFMLRVNEWSYRLLARIIGYPMFLPDDELGFLEQTALVKLLEKDEALRKSTVYVPRVWFNGYFQDPEQSMRGRLLVHFPAPNQKWRMFKWLERLQIERGKWELDLHSTSYEGEIKLFWCAIRRAAKVIKGFEKQADNTPDEVKNGSEDAKKEFEHLYEQLKKAIEEDTGEPEKLQGITDQAVEANRKYFFEAAARIE